MIRFGQPPYLECSSRGDERFSAFYAKINGHSIESIYQASKKFADGRTNLHWREAKGKVPINLEETQTLYSDLWRRYIAENPELLDVLKSASGVSDMFGQEGHCCQAKVLWDIRNDALAKPAGE